MDEGGSGCDSAMAGSLVFSDISFEIDAVGSAAHP